MAEKTIDAVGFGALNYDHVDAVDYREPWDDIPEDYEGYRTQVRAAYSTEKSAGGSAANTTYGLGKLGLRTAFMGAVGCDLSGVRVLESFSEVNVDTRGISSKEASDTGMAFCFAYPGGEREIFIVPGANNSYDGEDLDLALTEILPLSSLVHITSFTGDQQFDLQKKLVDSLPSDIEVSFSPGALYVARGYDEIEPLLSHSDYLFLNLDELLELTCYPIECIDEAARTLLTASPRIQAVVLTLGSGFSRPNTIYRYMDDLTLDSLSSIVFGRNQTVEVPARPDIIAFIDSVGAGDSYAAGFLYGRLNGCSLEEAANLGDRVARLCVSGKGARSTLPIRSQIMNESS